MIDDADDIIDLVLSMLNDRQNETLMPDEPRFWMNETTGVLAPVVEAYLNGYALTPQEVAIMRAYIRQWIDAPVWNGDPELEALRRRVGKIETREDIDRWLHEAIDLGIDPL